LTSFEKYFSALKKALGKTDVYEIWPDFEPHFDVQEYAWTTLPRLGEVLLLNCGTCEGPSDTRHARCKSCVEKRSQGASEAYQKATGRPKQKWPVIILCRIYAE